MKDNCTLFVFERLTVPIGGAFFNHLSNPDGSLAMPNEGPSLDSCLGHSAPIMGGGAGSIKCLCSLDLVILAKEVLLEEQEVHLEEVRLVLEVHLEAVHQVVVLLEVLHIIL